MGITSRENGLCDFCALTKPLLVFLPADEWEELCIVAVSESVSTAMASGGFQQLLGSLGLQPPNEQVKLINIYSYDFELTSYWFFTLSHLMKL